MNVQSMITLYRNGFFISLLIALIGLTAAVLVFIKFDIYKIWLIRSGRSRRQSIKKMDSDSRAIGRMRSDSPGSVGSQAASEQTGDIKKTEDLEEGLSLGTEEAEPLLSKTTIPTEVLHEAAATMRERGKSGNTMELLPGQMETVMLTEPASVRKPDFRITQEVVVIHCEDVID